MSNLQPVRIFCLTLVLMAAFSVGGVALAETGLNWTGNTSIAWGDAGNWNPSGPPVAGETAVFSDLFTGSSQLPQVQSALDTTVINGIWMTGAPGKNVTISRDATTTNGLTITPIDSINGVAGLGILIDNTSAFTFNINAPVALGADQEWRNTTNNIAALASSQAVISGAANLKLRSTGNMKQSRFNFGSRPHTYSGVLTIAQGMLSLNAVNNISANGPLGNSTNAVVLGDVGDLLGYLRYIGATATSTKPFTMATGGRGGFKIEAATATKLTLNGLISGSGGLVKFGAADNGTASTLALGNTGNGWSGGTSIYDGIISVPAANCLGPGTVTLDYKPAYLGVSGDDGQSGLVELQFTGDTTINSAGATPRNIVINAGEGSVGGVIDVTTTLSSLAGDNALSGPGALKKAGTGVLTLTGNNAGFTGAITVAEGTLALSGNGSLANSPVIQVNTGAWFDGSAVTGGANFASGMFSLASGQTVKGDGFVIGPMRIASGATVAPGAGIGILEIRSGATIDGTLKIEYDGSVTDSLTVSGAAGGDFNLDGMVNAADYVYWRKNDNTPENYALWRNNFGITPGRLNITNATLDLVNVGSDLQPGNYIIAQYNTLIGSSFAHVNGLPAGFAINYAFGGNNIAIVSTAGAGAGGDLHSAAVPEPGTIALALVGGLGLMVSRQRVRAA